MSDARSEMTSTLPWNSTRCYQSLRLEHQGQQAGHSHDQGCTTARWVAENSRHVRSANCEKWNLHISFSNMYLYLYEHSRYGPLRGREESNTKYMAAFRQVAGRHLVFQEEMDIARWRRIGNQAVLVLYGAGQATVFLLFLYRRGYLVESVHSGVLRGIVFLWGSH